MRKYRGLTKEGKWVYGWYFTFQGCCDGQEFTQHLIGDLENHDEVIPETVGQFTGFHDKNGKVLDWWEDDLFMLNDYLRQIIFADGCFMFLTIFNNNQMPCKDVLGWAELPTKVGNVHKNPELLKVEQ